MLAERVARLFRLEITDAGAALGERRDASAGCECRRRAGGVPALVVCDQRPALWPRRPTMQRRRSHVCVLARVFAATRQARGSHPAHQRVALRRQRVRTL